MNDQCRTLSDNVRNSGDWMSAPSTCEGHIIPCEQVDAICTAVSVNTFDPHV